jgi:hypothetical protein
VVELRHGIATYDGNLDRKRPDWTYAPAAGAAGNS